MDGLKKLTFHEKMVELQRISAVEKIKKGSVSFASRNLTTIYEHLKPYLTQLGLILIINTDIIMVGEDSYVKATAKISDENEDGRSASAFALIPKATFTVTEITGLATDNRGVAVADTISKTIITKPNNRLQNQSDPQVIGSCTSYAGKYAVQILLCMDDNVDIDSVVNKEEPKSIPKQLEKTAVDNNKNFMEKIAIKQHYSELKTFLEQIIKLLENNEIVPYILKEKTKAHHVLCGSKKTLDFMDLEGLKTALTLLNIRIEKTTTQEV